MKLSASALVGLLSVIAAADVPQPAMAFIDGDTLTISGERIRIANIDTPEIGHAQCDAEKRLGKVAKRRLAELMAVGPYTLHRGDPVDGRTKDRHGRTLATIEIAGKDIGETLIAEDLARPWQGKRSSWCSPLL